MLQPAQKGPIEGEANLTIFDGAGSGSYSTAEPWPPLPRERFSPLAHCGPTPAHDRPLAVPVSGALTGATSLPSTRLGSLETLVSARENGANRGRAACRATQRDVG